MKKRDTVFLVGPMGAGKSTIGRLLAEEMHLEFRDADREIEERSGVDIPWIFDMEGEAGFRAREAAMLAELSEMEGVVISTGGGAVTSAANRSLMAASGQVAYLFTSVEEQVRRTARDRKRPLLQQGDPAETLANLMRLRDPLYREIADIVVNTDGRSPKSVVRELQSKLAPGDGSRDWSYD